MFSYTLKCWWLLGGKVKADPSCSALYFSSVAVPLYVSFGSFSRGGSLGHLRGCQSGCLYFKQRQKLICFPMKVSKP